MKIVGILFSVLMALLLMIIMLFIICACIIAKWADDIGRNEEDDEKRK